MMFIKEIIFFDGEKWATQEKVGCRFYFRTTVLYETHGNLTTMSKFMFI